MSLGYIFLPLNSTFALVYLSFHFFSRHLLSENYRQLYDGSEERNRKLEGINQELREDKQKVAERLSTVEEQVATLMQNMTIKSVKEQDNARGNDTISH
ncbi:hypothetical protein IC220_03605 [Wolbachia endosymbiont of Pentalonia nigronervosa]|uniref:hypothetical protein n=1 Tax=Wolbachia endosymbiont of Pentalonia nigronervosa TaxID=1301914 RepID=UPI00165EE640|nr:hypothetical protein [Wolbachia endosymbiont of Pentalonia nigronervosa]MBD0391541.1 hypothetical protein [Wolbachia endosymbiont of Pentalonia nigronervosa]